MGIFGSAGRSVGGGKSTPSGGRSYSAKVSHPTKASRAANAKGVSTPTGTDPAEAWSPPPYIPERDEDSGND